MVAKSQSRLLGDNRQQLSCANYSPSSLDNNHTPHRPSPPMYFFPVIVQVFSAQHFFLALGLVIRSMSNMQKYAPCQVHTRFTFHLLDTDLSDPPPVTAFFNQVETWQRPQAQRQDPLWHRLRSENDNFVRGNAMR